MYQMYLATELTITLIRTRRFIVYLCMHLLSLILSCLSQIEISPFLTSTASVPRERPKAAHGSEHRRKRRQRNDRPPNLTDKCFHGVRGAAMDYGACAERMHFAAMAAADATNAKRLLPPRRQPRSTRYFFRKLELDDWTWRSLNVFDINIREISHPETVRYEKLQSEDLTTEVA